MTLRIRKTASTTRRRQIALIIATAALVPSAAAFAKPSVFVRGVPGSSWYYGYIEARVLNKTAGGVTTEQLSKFINDTEVFNTYEVCSLEQVSAETYAGVDKQTQVEIDIDQRNANWRLAATTPDGKTIFAHSVLFEACDDEELRGAALLVTDPATNEILVFKPLGQYTRQQKTFPAWVLFLHPKSSDELFSYSGCTECGGMTSVYYDVIRKKLYFEYDGH